jgi:hypothetical protein
VMSAIDTDAVPPGHVRTSDGAWLALGRVRAVEAWIDTTRSGVRVHLDDARTIDLVESDSGNVDPTATWNEYLYDGAWALAWGKAFAEWIGVSYRDAWTTSDAPA